MKCIICKKETDGFEDLPICRRHFTEGLNRYLRARPDANPVEIIEELSFDVLAFFGQEKWDGYGKDLVG